MSDVVKILCSFSDNSLDSRMKDKIKTWSDPPKALQVLEVLDHCINGALASGFVVSALQILYGQQCIYENTTHEEVVRLATWRT